MRPGWRRWGHYAICAKLHAKLDVLKFSGYVLLTVPAGKPMIIKEKELAAATRQASPFHFCVNAV